MRAIAVAQAGIVALALGIAAPVSAEVKKTAYPQVKVEVADAYQPDAAFEVFRKAFTGAVTRRDADALMTLVAPGFVWTIDDQLAADFDPGRDAGHNFKVVFGFRGVGKDSDGGVADGPFWDVLAAFARDESAYRVSNAGQLVCSPLAATVADDAVFEQAREKVESGEEGANWYFALRDTPVAKAPGDLGAPVGRLTQEAFPVLSTYPPAGTGQPDIAPTHYEVLLPSGQTGWIRTSAARPLVADHLCYARTATGNWKIAIYSAVE